MTDHLQPLTLENCSSVDSRLTYCNATFDSYLCWPPTLAGEVVTQNCPPARLSDITQFAFRHCALNGLWLTRRVNESSTRGWTNYTPCFPPDVQTMLIQVYDTEEEAQQKFYIAQSTRDMELVGFSVSLLSLMISLAIFKCNKCLHNNRTRIHMNLFQAMILQVIIRLILYIDQYRVRGQDTLSEMDPDFVAGIDNMPYVCEAAYILLEFFITVTFMCMFLEGYYLHNVVTSKAMRDVYSSRMNFIVGWGLSFVITAIWVGVSAYNYNGDTVNKCWYGYNFNQYYWILQGPRLAVCIINFLFLTNIIRVIVVKLRCSEESELARAKKAARATFILLPLLGINNFLNMIEVPLDSSVVMFGIWSYSTHFLRSFQGFFIAVIYCFTNSEVIEVMRKHYQDYMEMRAMAERRERQRRGSYYYKFNFAYPEPEPSPIIMVPEPEPSTSTSTGQPQPAISELHPLSAYKVTNSGEPNEWLERRRQILQENLTVDLMSEELGIEMETPIDDTDDLRSVPLHPLNVNINDRNLPWMILARNRMQRERMEETVVVEMETEFGPDSRPESAKPDAEEGESDKTLTPVPDDEGAAALCQVQVEAIPSRLRSPLKTVIFKDADGPVVDDPDYDPDDPELDEVFY